MHMNDSSSAVSLNGILASLPGAQTSAAPTAAVLEVMIYTVRDLEGFVPLAARVHRTASTFFGFEGSLAMIGLGEPVFADFFAWTSIEAALLASHRLERDAGFLAYDRALGEVRLFARYALVQPPKELFAGLRSAPVIELAAYGVGSAALTPRLHARLHELLRKLPGFRFGLPLLPLGDAPLRGDLVGWESVDVGHQLAGALARDPELSTLVQGRVERRVLSLLTALD